MIYETLLYYSRSLFEFFTCYLYVEYFLQYLVQYSQDFLPCVSVGSMQRLQIIHYGFSIKLIEISCTYKCSLEVNEIGFSSHSLVFGVRKHRIYLISDAEPYTFDIKWKIGWYEIIHSCLLPGKNVQSRRSAARSACVYKINLRSVIWPNGMFRSFAVHTEFRRVKFQK